MKPFVYLVYSCDAWHTPGSKTLIYIATGKDYILQAVNSFCKQYHMKEIINQEALQFLEQQQTQGRTGNFMFQKEFVNEPLY